MNGHTDIAELLSRLGSESRGHVRSALIGESDEFQEAKNLALRFAVPDINVLLVGETGTGKELFSRMIHSESKRSAGPFIAVDCSMLPENLIESELFGHEMGSFTGAVAARVGRFEMAQGGTLFLDEISNLSLSFQAKLLRVLQERRMERVGGRETIRLDVRVISATNVDPINAIREEKVRPDLYYRLNEMTINIPPLRKRNGDIRRITRHYIHIYSKLFGKATCAISGSVLELLEGHAWPGNVRELENAIKSAVVLADNIVLPEHLPREIRGNGGRPTVVENSQEENNEERLHVEIDLGVSHSEIDLKALGCEAAEQAERLLLEALMRRSGLSGAQMARMLNVDPKTLRMKLRKYGLVPQKL